MGAVALLLLVGAMLADVLAAGSSGGAGYVYKNKRGEWEFSTRIWRPASERESAALAGVQDQQSGLQEVGQRLARVQGQMMRRLEGLPPAEHLRLLDKLQALRNKQADACAQVDNQKRELARLGRRRQEQRKKLVELAKRKKADLSEALRIEDDIPYLEDRARTLTEVHKNLTADLGAAKKWVAGLRKRAGQARKDYWVVAEDLYNRKDVGLPREYIGPIRPAPTRISRRRVVKRVEGSEQTVLTDPVFIRNVPITRYGLPPVEIVPVEAARPRRSGSTVRSDAVREEVAELERMYTEMATIRERTARKLRSTERLQDWLVAECTQESRINAQKTTARLRRDELNCNLAGLALEIDEGIAQIRRYGRDAVDATGEKLFWQLMKRHLAELLDRAAAGGQLAVHVVLVNRGWKQIHRRDLNNAITLIGGADGLRLSDRQLLMGVRRPKIFLRDAIGVEIKDSP